MTEKEVCYTCKEPYTKPPTSRATICSNPFHCCRDCIWEITQEAHGFIASRLVQSCDDCRKEDERNEEWFKNQLNK